MIFPQCACVDLVHVSVGPAESLEVDAETAVAVEVSGQYYYKLRHFTLHHFYYFYSLIKKLTLS